MLKYAASNSITVICQTAILLPTTLVIITEYMSPHENRVIFCLRDVSATLYDAYPMILIPVICSS